MRFGIINLVRGCRGMGYGADFIPRAAKLALLVATVKLMEKFFNSIWQSITKLFDKLADKADAIVLSVVLILLTLIGAKIVIVISNGIIRKTVKRRKRKHPDSLIARKSETIATLMQSIIRYTVYFLATATILGQLGLGITAGSILATAGIGGVALGLGAQGLIKDVFSGFFLLFENQFAVGDYVEIMGQKGTVEAVTVRTTQIRAFTGELIIFANGTIDKVINFTRGNILVVLSIFIAVGEEPHNAMAVMKERVQRYAASHEEITEPPEFIGVNNVGEDGTELRALIWVRPMTQWKVERELKADVYAAFQEKGITVPYPKRVVIDNGK